MYDILGNMSDEERQRFHMKRAVDEVYVNNPPSTELHQQLLRQSRDIGRDPDEAMINYMTAQVLDQYKFHIDEDRWWREDNCVEYKVDVTKQLDSVQTCKNEGVFDDKKKDTFWKACEGRVVASIPLEVITYIKHQYGLDQSDPDFMKEIRRLALVHDDQVLRGCLVNDW